MESWSQLPQQEARWEVQGGGSVPHTDQAMRGGEGTESQVETVPRGLQPNHFIDSDPNAAHVHLKMAQRHDPTPLVAISHCGRRVTEVLRPLGEEASFQ